MATNNLIVRTNKGEYYQGETIYGAVYLQIGSPAEACGVKLSFKGIETCSYMFGKRVLKNETTHVDICPTELYSCADCFQFGCYVFPFQFELLQDAPGSIHYSGSYREGTWKVDIVYTIFAFVQGAEAIQDKQVVVVYPACHKELADRLGGTANEASYQVSRFPMRKKIHTIVKILDNYAETGTNLELRLIITNPTSVKITRFQVKVIRYFTLFLRDEYLNESVPENIEIVCGVCHIAPEWGPLVVNTIAGCSDTILAGNAGLDRLQVPLREVVNGCQEELPPSVKGQHIHNHYAIEVTLEFSNSETKTVVLKLNVGGVLPRKNKKWHQWKPPEWCNQSQRMQSSSRFSVPSQILCTETFAMLPTFQ